MTLLNSFLLGDWITRLLDIEIKDYKTSLIEMYPAEMEGSLNFLFTFFLHHYHRVNLRVVLKRTENKFKEYHLPIIPRNQTAVNVPTTTR